MAKKLAKILLLLAILLLEQAGPGQSRSITNDDFPLSMVTDGGNQLLLQNQNVWKQFFSGLMDSLFSSDSSCEQTYGFLPCTSTVLGNIFLVLVYGYLMFLSAKLLSNGSEILLQILGPGIVGGLFLPLLGSLPDATIILASGLSGDTETAQSQVSVGMGLMAGSNVMLLTILWGTCLIVGKCDIENSIAVDQKDEKRFSLTGSGVSTDIWTSYSARIMIISLIPFVIVQLPQVFHATSNSRLAILISLAVSISFVIAYSFYQVFQPWIQKRKLAYSKHKHVMSEILKQLKTNALGRLLTNDGDPNKVIIQKLFKTLDQDSDGYLNTSDLRSLIIGIQFDDIDINIDEAIIQVMKDFDTSHDSKIDEDEFFRGISRWLNKAKRAAIMDRGKIPQSMKLLEEYDQKTKKEYDQFGDQIDEVVEDVKNAKWHASKAVVLLFLGTIVAAAVADPLVDAVDNFSTATSIPSFFISFVVLPFASSSEIVTTLIFVSRKKQRTASLAYSEIYGSVTMSNILSLAVFLGLVYVRNLTWSFSAEVLVILIVCILMGAIASFRTTFPLWMSSVAILLYPLSLLLVYILDYICGWS
ncbi:sodium/calcium exchanger NCL-like [Pyrus x bretschneideri]|uniref:sodium/calcium exchanger NCL-like n=1 Tax=Pyrus x bretschneideri TaxID=225117 RepID=UPI0020307DF5|nr:sodium/calcium exchanger NCL-like [Pyrus x bretschneideri]